MAWQDYIGSYTLMYVSQDILDEMAGSHQLGIFFRLDTDPGLHIWLGTNDIPAGFDSIDPDGTVYLGGGTLLSVEELEVLINGTSSAVNFGISGIDKATAQRAIAVVPDVRGKAVNVGLTTLDRYYQPMSKIISVWQGVASHPIEAIQPVSGANPMTMQLSLAVVSGDNTRSTPSLSLWSPAHQKAEFPTDLYCDGTARLARGISPEWPQYD